MAKKPESPTTVSITPPSEPTEASATLEKPYLAISMRCLEAGRGGWVFERLTIQGDKVIARETRIGDKSESWDRAKFCMVTDFLVGKKERLR